MATTSFSGLIWLILLLIGLTGVLSMLHAMAVVARSHMQLHDTRRKVFRLRLRYAAELAGQPEGEFGDVDILEVDSESSAAPVAKAA